MKTTLQTVLDHQIQIRVNFNKILESLPEDKLFEIPVGFKNNIIWNYAHCVVTQQLLVYKLAGLPVLVDEKLIETYKKGTEAKSEFISGFKGDIIIKSFSCLEKLQKDILSPEMFNNYSKYTTSFGVELVDFESAMIFNNIHEGLHLGYAMALRKVLQ